MKEELKPSDLKPGVTQMEIKIEDEWHKIQTIEVVYYVRIKGKLIKLEDLKKGSFRYGN